ncbi:MAG: hypothetical protein Fur0044_19990 [Anaerolineae bacterium]|nr:hypothetical protein [Anaerolineales bacterium]MCQ3975677.1 hypothetical protein [Anaerolineae bacterium]
MSPEKNPIDLSASLRSSQFLALLKILGLVWGLAALLLACAPEEPRPLPTPTPTATRPLVIPDNDNVKALNAAKAALGDFEFGFASLLEEDATKIVIEPGPLGEVARLAYPPQPANPAEWPAVDSFILSYAIQQSLMQSPQVQGVALGRFGVAAPLDDLQDRVDHVAVWARFADGSQAIVDFSPLASSFGSLHSATELLTDAGQIENQFAQWRQGVPLDLLQPMKVVKKQNNVYYLLAQVLITPERYHFSLRAHLTQTATPIQPLRLTRGAAAVVEIKRTDYEALRKLLLADGPTAFNEKPELLTHRGDPDPTIQTVLTDQLPLLWHLVTKLEHQLPPPDATPVPTVTPTPTATRPALPQDTS